MKILYIDNVGQICNYYKDIRDYLKKFHTLNIVNSNIKEEINKFNPDIVLVGFSITDTGENAPTINLNNINKPLYIILNKEYAGLNNKLDWIKKIYPKPVKIFSVHHDVKKYQKYCQIPFCKIMWSANEEIFKKYDEVYNHDLFFSGVIRKEQTDNMRNKIYNKLNELSKYKLLVKAAFFENNKLKGQLNTFSNLEYAKKINESRIVLTTTGPADLVGTRYFEIMASNKALILCNRMSIEIYEDIVIDGFNCVMFNDENDFVIKCKYYLENEKERIKIVRNAYKYFIEKQTWTHKLDHLLNNL
jgi:spore maturation protein CgeB|tara:strand:+ start:185 stop:1093 length:909 start_codon:yes stop_codon:yes gene_type:complete